MVKQLASMEEYENAIGSDKITLIDFTATWCPPCQMIGPKFEELANDPANASIQFFKVDVDDNDKAAEEAEIQAMPSFHFYQNGAKIAEVIGANFDKVKAEVESRR